MAGGTGSTLIIHPTGLSDLTMGLSAAEPYTGSTPYVVPLQTLNFNEEKRWQIIYEQSPLGEGGAAIGEFGPLVPLTHQVVIKTNTRAAMIEAFNDLQAALLNRRGGTVEYKPEDLGAGIRSTFYHYVRSGPPRLLDTPGNRWDAAPKSDEMYTLLVEVEFSTQPIATSDPDSPVTLSDLAATIQNWVDSSPSQTNRVTVQASNLAGTMPALLRILARPGSSQYLGRLIAFRRSEGTLANFACIYEAEDADVIYPSVAWTEVADSDRGDGAYMQCLPSSGANGAEQGLRFTISNPDDHKGRFAVFGVGYDDADATGTWTHQAQVKCGNVIQEGEDDWEAQGLHDWRLVYAGEFELPPLPLSDSESGYDTGPYIEWYSTRASGESEFRLDAILLVYVADSNLQPTALDVQCADEGGVTNSEKLLVENLPGDYGLMRELAHVVAQTDGDFKRALLTAPRGDFLMLDPTADNLLVFVQEQASGQAILEDNFEGYGGSRWRLIADMESDETWSPGSAETLNYKEGSQSIETADSISAQVAIAFSPVLDLLNDGRFTDDDFICFAVHLVDISNIDHITAMFEDSDTPAHDEMREIWWSGAITANWNFLVTKKSLMDLGGSGGGSFNWDEVSKLSLSHTLSSETTISAYDYYRVEKADPDDADYPNATGSQWNFQPKGLTVGGIGNSGHWTITEDVAEAGATLACLDTESGVEKTALIDEPALWPIKYRARVMAKRDAGYVGIVWGAQPDTLTEGAEDCHAAVLDIAGDWLRVRTYSDGAITIHGGASESFACVVDTWYVVGVIAKRTPSSGKAYYVYATAASNLTNDDDIFDSAYLMGMFTSFTHGSGGQVGVMSISTLGRFDQVKLVSLQDKMIPADEITLEGKAIFRTIAPFME